MPQEILELHGRGVLYRRLFFRGRAFVDIVQRGLADLVEPLWVSSNDADRPSVNEAL